MNLISENKSKEKVVCEQLDLFSDIEKEVINKEQELNDEKEERKVQNTILNIKNKYDSIINLEHYELKYHKRMSIEARAAQFAPFAALTGYSDEIIEAARLTDNKIDMFEDSKLIIDRKLQMINEHIKEKLEVSIIYFIPDNKKIIKRRVVNI